MGCGCSAPRVSNPHTPSRKGLKSFQQLGCGFRLSNKKLKRPSYRSAGTNEKSNVMSVLEVLMVAKDVIDQDFKGLVSPHVLAAIALIESGGVVDAMKYEDHLDESRHGLCQMLFSTARFLSVFGYKRYSISKAKSLHSPRTALYYGAAYLIHLSTLNGEKRSEEFVVRGYFGGPKDAYDSSTDESWEKYSRARAQLNRLEEAIREEDDIDELQPTIHVLQQGETLSQVARICGTSVSAILEVNPDIKEGETLQAGDCIEIPVKHILPRLYVVKASDSMASIARKHDVSLFRLLKANPEIKNSNQIRLGWVMSIPGLVDSPNDIQDQHFSRGGLISAGVESGAYILNAMAERYGLAMDENMWGGEGLGIFSREDLRERLQAPRSAPLLRIPGSKSVM